MNQTVVPPASDPVDMSSLTPPVPPLPSSPKKFKINTLLLIVVLLFLFSGALYAAYYYGTSQNNPPVVPQNTPTPEPTVTTESDGEYGQISWLSTPKKITNPDILSQNPDLNDLLYSYSDLGTHHVADFSSGAKLILLAINPEGPGDPYLFRLIESDGQYLLIESFLEEKYEKEAVRKIFDLDKVKIIAYDTLGLLPPETIQTENQKTFITTLDFFSSQLYSQLENPQKITSSEFGDLYVVYSQPYENKSVYSRKIFLKLADSTIKAYDYYIDFIADNQVPLVTFSTTQNKDAFQPGVPSGCGLGSAKTILKSSSDLLLDKQEVGFLTNNPTKKIYQFTNPQHEIVKFLYDNYKVGRDYPEAPPMLSIEEYAQKNNHFIYQDVSGDWLIFVNSEFAPMAECGKPVIYLYPTTDTQVTVKVAADITQSEPTYPVSGWTVLAKPSGQLIYQTKSYPNLFWEGKGHGFYPDKSAYGTLVTQDKLISTLKSQLTAQGLNSQESADFMEFWTDLLPQDPYVRLTWLNTSEMDRLAPLSVSPAPDTSIRIFLEFEGYSTPVKLIPQNLKSVPRQGFTLVEWGGLLIRQ
jgi:hypothetical protein